MATSSFPFDGQDTTEDQYSHLFREFQHDGVIANISASDLAVTASGNGLTANVAAGRAILRGYVFESTAVEQVTIPTPVSGTVIHRVILRCDPTLNSIVIAVLQGTSATVPPALTQTDNGIFEIALATVTVTASTVTLTASQITDERRFTGSVVGVWKNASSRPLTPRTGRLGYNVADNKWEFWNGTAWVDLTTSTPGLVAMHAGPTAPAGYVLCDGSEYTTAQYPALYAVIGTRFGSSGAGKFKVPDLRSRFPQGSPDAASLGQTGGSATKTLTVPNLPAHTHTGRTNTDGSHTHGAWTSPTDGGHVGTVRQGYVYDRSVNTPPVVSDGSTHSHAFTTDPTGTGTPLDVIPPFAYLNFIIKV